MGNIGTGNYTSLYFRPDLKKTDIAPEKAAGFTKLDGNTWANTWKAGRVSRKPVYHTSVITKAGKDCYIFDVPTDSKGQLSDVVMAERLLDVESGDRQGHVRNVFVDIGINAEKRHSAKDLAETYRWYLHPNESDVKQIDDANSQIVTILGKNETSGKRTLIITGGTKEDRDKLAYDLTKNFTIRERQLVAGCLIQIQPCRGYAGCFQGHSDASGKPIGVPKIIIDNHYAKVSDVIIHEAIHALREFDPKRDARLRAVKSYFGRDADLEESLTEAETVTRQNPFEKHESTAGYYHHITIPNKTKGQIIISDRVTLTGDAENWKTSGKKGKRAQRMLLAKYPATYISHFKLRGNSEAIDTYYETVNKQGSVIDSPGVKTHLQFYNPKATTASESNLDKSVKELPFKSFKWNDGRKVPLNRLPTPKAKPRHKAPRTGLNSKRIGKQYYTRIHGHTAVSRRPLSKRNRRR